MKGELIINGQDAYETWGVSLSEGAIATLLTPPPMKAYISFESRAIHGKQVYNPAKVDSRSITLEIHMTAKDKNDFMSKYISFCNELKKGQMYIKTKYQPDVVYKMMYVSCNQFRQFMFGIAKFSLKLDEPNPNDRE